MQYQVEVRHIAPQATLGIETRTTIPGIPAFLGEAYGEVFAFAGMHGAAPAGPPFVFYFGAPEDGNVHLFAGVPVQPAIAGGDRVQARELPGGDIAVVEYFGPYDGVGPVYDDIAEWAAANGRTLQPEMWEVYWTDPVQEPDPAKWRTEVVWPLA